MKVILKWTKVANATGYNLKLTRVLDGVVTTADVGDVSEYEIDIIEPSDYKWAIIPYNSSRVGDNYNERTIQVDVFSPDLEAPPLVSPEDNAVVELDSAAWNPDLPSPVNVIFPNNGALKIRVDNVVEYYKNVLRWMTGGVDNIIDGYTIEIKKDGGAVQTFNVVNRYTNWLDFTFEKGASYEWRVIPYNSAGNAQNCPWWTFTTEALTKTNSPIYTIGDISTSDSEFTIPLTVKNFSSVRNFDLMITYDESVIKAKTKSLAHANLITDPNLFVSGRYDTGKLKVAFVRIPTGATPDAPENFITLPDDSVIVNLAFEKVAPGSTALNFDNSGELCLTGYWSDGPEVFNDDPAATYYISGSAVIS